MKQTTRTFCRAICAAVVLAALTPGLFAHGWVEWGGDVHPHDPATWDSSTWAYIGKDGSGELGIRGGHTLINNVAYVGYNAGSSGRVVLLEDSMWANMDLYIGYKGQGGLFVFDGAVISRDGFIGYEPESLGLVLVPHGSTWTNSGDLYVGYAAEGGWGMPGGLLGIAEGGAVSNVSGYIGYDSGSWGQVVVTDFDSSWTNSGDLCVGCNGAGALTISAGGMVSVGGTLTSLDADSYIKMYDGGMLALYGEAADSLDDFLALVNGIEVIRYWDWSIMDWADIAGAVDDEDYTLSYLTEGDLAGYTLLTVWTGRPIPGDANGDGSVDLNDFVILKMNFGRADATWAMGDFNGDGKVDLDDFVILKNNFGATADGS